MKIGSMSLIVGCFLFDAVNHGNVTSRRLSGKAVASFERHGVTNGNGQRQSEPSLFDSICALSDTTHCSRAVDPKRASRVLFNVIPGDSAPKLRFSKRCTFCFLIQVAHVLQRTRVNTKKEGIF